MEDHIERKDVIECINEWDNMYPDSDTAREALAMVRYAIINIPSVEPKQGKWKVSKAYPHIVFCDECGAPFERSNNTEHFNFCPNCGAKMKIVNKD